MRMEESAAGRGGRVLAPVYETESQDRIQSHHALGACESILVLEKGSDLVVQSSPNKTRVKSAKIGAGGATRSEQRRTKRRVE